MMNKGEYLRKRRRILRALRDRRAKPATVRRLLRELDEEQARGTRNC